MPPEHSNDYVVASVDCYPAQHKGLSSWIQAERLPCGFDWLHGLWSQTLCTGSWRCGLFSGGRCTGIHFWRTAGSAARPSSSSASSEPSNSELPRTKTAKQQQLKKDHVMSHKAASQSPDRHVAWARQACFPKGSTACHGWRFPAGGVPYISGLL